MDFFNLRNSYFNVKQSNLMYVATSDEHDAKVK